MPHDTSRTDTVNVKIDLSAKVQSEQINNDIDSIKIMLKGLLRTLNDTIK
jgi:hypothetical protein